MSSLQKRMLMEVRDLGEHAIYSDVVRGNHVVYVRFRNVDVRFTVDEYYPFYPPTIEVKCDGDREFIPEKKHVITGISRSDIRNDGWRIVSVNHLNWSPARKLLSLSHEIVNIIQN